MGITGRPGRLETRVTPSVSFSIRPVDGILAGRRFRFAKSTLFLKDPRADVSERGSPGLPGPGNRAAAGEPPRANRCRVRVLPRPNPLILTSGAAAAGSGFEKQP